ncbi:MULTISPECIES: metal-sulfur cluster assembly factor [Bacillaceae]|uniref:metal-sulfur cluster assembly factor n=1 Tax=Bacillaceae TaxID=186817 RepID=UPI001BDECD87|nr:MULTISPECIES: metal-sulfur cluster assembly factor [Bacillaceae]MDX8361352.1 metal-sulfur cluster assembly factor [Cytobacillus sp. IB215316]
MSLTEKVYSRLYEVIDPELNINIVDLGLIYDVTISTANDVSIIMTLTTPGCPLHDSIVNGVKHVIEQLGEVHTVNVQLVWEPAWTPQRMSQRALQTLQGI